MTAPPPPPTVRQYFLTKNGETFGPMQKEALAELLRNGQASQSDLVWFEGAADWLPIASLGTEILGGSAPPPIPQRPTPEFPPIKSPVEELEGMIRATLAKHPKVKKSFLGSSLTEKQRTYTNKLFPQIAKAQENILFAGNYSFGPMLRLGLAMTDKTFYSQTVVFMGFRRKKATPLGMINSLSVGFGAGKGLNRDQSGSDIAINGKCEGSFSSFTLPKKDEEMLKDLFAQIVSSGVLLKFR